jgi:hypothetical protein
MGLAYGYSPEELGIDKLVVSADELIDSRITLAQWNEQKAKEAVEQKTKGKGKKTAERASEEAE